MTRINAHPQFSSTQHCRADECYTFSHTAQWCGKDQPEFCPCPYDYPEGWAHEQNLLLTGVITSDSLVSPTKEDTMDTRYVVFDTDTQQVVSVWYGNTTLDPEEAKDIAAKLNRDRKPEYQTLTVATLNFDTEI